MSKWYLTTMDYIIGDFSTKHEALQNVGVIKFKCHRKHYGYSIDIKDESDGWHYDSMWIMRREKLIKNGFLPQLAKYEKDQKGDAE